MNQLSGDQEKRALRVFLYGAIGDAAGKAFEVAPWAEKSARSVPDPLTFLEATYDGLGEHGKLPGFFTDDTQMTIALARSMRRWNPNPPNVLSNPPEPLQSGYDPDRAAEFYLEWFQATDADAPRGIGGTVRRAMENLKRGVSRELAGIDPVDLGDHGYCGNGTAMRASPLGLFYRDADLSELFGHCRIDARITHRHPEAVAGSYAVALGVKYGLQLAPGDRDQWIVAISEALSKRRETRYTRVATAIRAVAGTVALSGRWNGDYRLDPQHAGALVAHTCGESGDVAETVSSAFMCALLDFGDIGSAEKWTAHDRLRAAILVGGDCDTRAAITGQMLAALGYELPAELCETVEASKYLVTLAKDMLRG